jgi:hypothetical protein
MLSYSGPGTLVTEQVEGFNLEHNSRPLEKDGV